MANEITVTSSMKILKDNERYQSPAPTSFTADKSGFGGPTPGSISVSTDGTDVDLSELTTPGVCYIQNQDSVNYVTVGIWNPDQSEFYPLMELLPGEGFVFRLSREINEEWAGTGTGQTAEQNTLRIKAANAACKVLVSAFEK